MENNNKYFIPDISDLCIGYELEVNYNFKLNDVFYKEIIKSFEELSDIQSRISGDCVIRIPYLTKEQLEAEGWKECTLNDNEQALLLFSKNGYDLRIYKDYIYHFSELMVGRGIEDCWDKVLFEGKCKDINTFRRICKLLEI